jgi:pyridoxal phosphate enzyme (YggS family)
VKVVAVTKEATVRSVEAAAAAGITDFGENRAQLLRAKADAVAADVRWHFLGSIQTNKVKLLDDVVLLHGLDRAAEAEALQARGERLDRSWDVLIEVNVAGEASKQGVAPHEIEGLLGELAAYHRVRPRGLMFVAPQVENVEDVRAMFAEARALRDRFASSGLEELSMGMTDDFEVAVEEGSTIVRIGRAIFRPEER